MKKRTTRYKVHIFICTRQRDDETKSCAEGDAPAVKERLKEIAEERGWKPKVRVSDSGCLGVCAAGPNVMIYPQQLWFAGVRLEDCDTIAEEVEALLAD
ncbi:MAG: ferredoxin [Kiritimatiellaceae bacterium TMED266]|jgi:(2Fe-2S) ferredoxin|nr:MAG: ferredoxin [Kiritimatiellaceae bacterium TMED266]